MDTRTLKVTAHYDLAGKGGGPAGLTVAFDLRRMGYAVTIVDAQPQLGGMLRYGIPRYRLPADVLDREIQTILDMGVEARTNTRVADPQKLIDNATTVIGAIVRNKPSAAKGKYIKSVTLSSTMGPGVPLDSAVADAAGKH